MHWRSISDQFRGLSTIYIKKNILKKSYDLKENLVHRGGGNGLATVAPLLVLSSGSSGRVRGGAEKHEIYAAAFGGHLFYDLFSQGQGGHGPLAPPGSATALLHCKFFRYRFVRKYWTPRLRILLSASFLLHWTVFSQSLQRKLMHSPYDLITIIFLSKFDASAAG